MYQQQQQLQRHQQHLSSRPSLPPEKQFLLHGGGDSSGLILSTDAKPRLKWTPELHERFVEAVNQLGGPEKATPKTIMRVMGIPGLTLYHLKSHLQKYRLSKNLQGQANAVVHAAKNVSGCRPATDNTPCEGNVSPAARRQSQFSMEPQIKCRSPSVHISEALHMQIEAQRRLHEQLEVQRHVQLRIEAQGKYLQSVLEKAQEALAAKNGSSVVVDGDADVAIKQQLAAKRLPHADGSVDSCLTACEGSHHQSRPQSAGVGGGGSSQQQLVGEDEDDGEEAAGRRPRSRASHREYMMFLDEPPSGGAAISPDDRRCGDRYGDGDGDGFVFGSATMIRRTAELDLDLSIVNNTAGGTCRRRPRDGIIDLNNNTGST